MKTQFTAYRCTELWKVVYPSSWKISHMCAVYKNVDEQIEISNYRLIGLLSCMSKILENIIYKSLNDHCVSHELLIRDNSGFQVH